MKTGKIIYCLILLFIVSGCGNIGQNQLTGQSTDTTPPVNTTQSNFINNGQTSTSSADITLSISATDNVGVTGFFVSENSASPSMNTSGWTNIQSTTSYSGNVAFKLSSGYGTKTVYVWFRDAAGNLSVSVNDSINFSTAITSSVVGTWGVISLHHMNDGQWQDEFTRVTFNADGTGSITGFWKQGANVSPAGDTFNYTSTPNSDGTFTLSMTSANWNSSTRFIPSDDGSMAVFDGTTDMNQQFFQVVVKMDNTNSNADLNGDYYWIGYNNNLNNSSAPVYGTVSGIYNFDGSGNYSRTNGTTNQNGTISAMSSDSGTYIVNSDGSVNMTTISFSSKNDRFLSGNAKLMVASPAENTDLQFRNRVFMKKGDKSYSNADLAGTWAGVGFGDNNEVDFLSVIGTMTCDSSGNCTWKRKSLKSDGSVTVQSDNMNLTVASDGSFGASISNGAPSYAGAIGNNSNTIMINSSFDQSTPEKRRVRVLVKSSNCGDLSQSPKYTTAGIHFKFRHL